MARAIIDLLKGWPNPALLPTVQIKIASSVALSNADVSTPALSYGYAHFGLILLCFVPNLESQGMALERTPAPTPETCLFDRDCVPGLSDADSEMCLDLILDTSL